MWPWNSPVEAARRAAAREARFIGIAREAHERARHDLGPQQLKPRDWESEPTPANDRREAPVRRIAELRGRDG
jgi:hypothetical protein